MSEVVDMKDFEKEQKRRKRKEKFDQLVHRFLFNEKIQAVKCWCSENKEIVMIVLPAVLTGAVFAVKSAIKHHNLHKEEQVKNLYCYDRSLGHYWKLRRELTNDEWVAIDKRKKNGERLADILDELKVLK